MIPRNAIDLVMTFEGFYARPYLCPAGVVTIGYGSTVYPDGKKVTLRDEPVTKEQAIEYMEWELNKSMVSVLKYCPVLFTAPETWLGAITDFVYNLGAGRLQQSTLRRKINTESWEDVPTELNKWVYGGGKRLKGLVLRRQAEAAFFM